MTYFKQHFESCYSEWTIYGCYSDHDIQREGDILCNVIEVRREDNKHLIHEVYKEYVEPDEVTEITKDEYISVINKIQETNDYYYKADEILKSLI